MRSKNRCVVRIILGEMNASLKLTRGDQYFKYSARFPKGSSKKEIQQDGRNQEKMRTHNFLLREKGWTVPYAFERSLCSKNRFGRNERQFKVNEGGINISSIVPVSQGSSKKQ